MIPMTTGDAGAPFATLFHVIIDHFNRTFSMDGPGGPNGVRLHYEMLQVARIQKKRLRDFDLRAEHFGLIGCGLIGDPATAL
jgi:hypothetical protein